MDRSPSRLVGKKWSAKPNRKKLSPAEVLASTSITGGRLFQLWMLFDEAFAAELVQQSRKRKSISDVPEGTGGFQTN